MEAEEMRLTLVLKLLDRGKSPWHVGTEAAALMAFISTGEVESPPSANETWSDKETVPSVLDPFTKQHEARLGHDKFGFKA